MPEVPDAAVQAAAEVMLRQYESEYSAAHLTWRDFTDPAREILKDGEDELPEPGHPLSLPDRHVRMDA